MLNNIKYAFKARKFPTKILILEKRQTGMRFKEDRGRRTTNTKTGETNYYLMRSGKTTKPIPRASAVATTMRGEDVVILYSPRDGSFYPLELDSKISRLIGVDEDLRAYIAQDESRSIQKWMLKKDMLMKYLPIITLVVFALSFVIMIYGAWTYGMSQIVDAFSQVSHQMVEVSQNLALVGKQVI